MSTDLAILGSHLSTLIEARSVSQHELDPLVAYAISETQDGRSSDTRRAQWEYLLKNEVFKLAATEGEALKGRETSYFDELKSRLDLVLAFTEHDVCDPSFTFLVLEDLLETQTVASCWHIFSWMEERSQRLTTNMVPAKGKSLVLLRTLNDLLRRLSKTGKNTMFCGRILNFLSNVFSLGERSGVNLRGDYGPQWDGPGTRRKDTKRPPSPSTTDIKAEPDSKKLETSTVKPEEQSKIPLDKTEEDKKDEFYQTFWSLQLPFSRPPLFASTISFESFRNSVDMVLPVIAEATKKERAMMGSKVVAGNLKRKREPSPSEGADSSGRDYFFAKFLTSPELLDLEIADTHFRRQFLFQLLILLQHLNFFTQSEKTKWEAPRNRSLHMEFTLGAADTKWAQDTWTRVMDELKATTPNGKVFADMVAVILEREQNWIKWKNDTCPAFDKEPIQPTLIEQTHEQRCELMKESPAWRYRFGTEALTEVWETGFRSLSDLEEPPGVGEIKDFAARIKKKEMQVERRKKQLAAMAPPKHPSPESAVKENQSQETSDATLSQVIAPVPSHVSVPVPPQNSAPTSTSNQMGPPPTAPIAVTAAPAGPVPLHPSLPPRPGSSPAPKPQTPKPPAAPQAIPTKPPPPQKQDEMLLRLTEDKDRLSWLALRRARTDYLPLFGKIGTGDVEMLMTSIEQEREKESQKEKEKEDREREKGVDSKDEKSERLPAVGSAERVVVSEANGDVKMETDTVQLQESPKEASSSQAVTEGGKSMDVDS